MATLAPRPQRYDFTLTKLAAYPRRVVTPEGDLTLPLSRQKRLLRDCISSGLAAGLVPLEAVKRATECLEWLRSQALQYDLDSENQEYLKNYAIAAMMNTQKDLGKTPGVMLAGRAWEATRAMQDYLRQRRYDEMRENKRFAEGRALKGARR